MSAMNCHLKDHPISVIEVWFVPPKFNLFRNTTHKEYRYSIIADLGKYCFNCHFKTASCWPLAEKLDIQKMKEGAKQVFFLFLEF